MIKYFDIPSMIEDGATVRRIERNKAGLYKIAQYDDLYPEVKKYIESITPEEGYGYLLISAVTDENWGENNNGDFFPEQGLSNKTDDYGFKTFEKMGYWYRLHDNKDPAKSFGKCVFSFWNPRMHRIELVVKYDRSKDDWTEGKLAEGEPIEVSMGCFKAGTQICMADGTLKNIEDMVAGDIVVTHKANKSRVTEVYKSFFRGHIYNIMADGCPMKATDYHPFLVTDTDKETIDPYWLEAYKINPQKHHLLTPIIYDNGYEIVEVESIEHHQEETWVYNFAVEEDESYIANGVAVHNCKVAYDICSICHPNWREFYKIPENKMRKLTKAQTLEEIYAIGDEFGVDLSYIKEMAEGGGPKGLVTKTESYCEHIKYQRGKYIGDRSVYMVNLRPQFFDISHVRRHADSSAYVLAKVAKDKTDKIEKVEGPEESEDGDKKAELTKEVPGIVLTDDQQKINDYFAKVMLPALEEYEEIIPNETLDSMSTSYSLPEIMSSMLALNMMPRPREFQRIFIVAVGGDDGKRIANELEKRKMFIDDNDVLEQYHKHPDITPPTISEDFVVPEIIEMLAPFIGTKSYYHEPLCKRIVMIKSGALGINEQPRRKAMGWDSPVGALMASAALYLGLAKATGKDIKPLLAKAYKHKYGLMAALGGTAIASGILQSVSDEKKVRANEFTRPVLPVYKDASLKKSVIKPLLLAGAGTLGTYTLSEHYLNRARAGMPLNRFQRTVAKHPFALSTGGILMGYGPSRKAILGLGKGLLKKGEAMKNHGIDFESLDINDYPLDKQAEVIVTLWHANMELPEEIYNVEE